MTASGPRALADQVEPPAAPTAPMAVVWELAPTERVAPRVCPELADLLGFDPSEWREPGFAFGRVDERDVARVEAFWRALLEAPYSQVEYRLRSATGAPRWFRDSAIVWSENGATRVRGATVDVHDDKTREVEATQRRALFASVLEAVADGVLVLDAQGQIVASNRQLATMWRIDPEVLAPGSSERALACLLEKVADSTTFRSRANRPSTRADGGDELLLADGRVLERYARPHVIGGKPVGLVISCRDVTATRKAEARYHDLLIAEKAARFEAEEARFAGQILADDLRHSLDELQRAQHELVRRERMSALGELSGTMAHEIRNSLGAIFNAIAALRRRVVVEGEVAVLLDIVRDEAKRLNRLVVDLLSFARPTRGSPMYQSVVALIDDALANALSAVERSGPVRVHKDFATELPDVYVDAGLTSLALTNLITNALQAMPSGGDLTIAVRALIVDDRTFVELRIEDSGSGVPPELLPRIFEPFFTTKALGTGLGLPIAKRLLDEQRGEVQAEPGLEHGATFVVRLPC